MNKATMEVDMTTIQLEKYHKEFISREEKIWRDLEEKLYFEYLSEGYYTAWAREKAKQETLTLRSKPNNPVKMTIPAEQTTQGDLD